MGKLSVIIPSRNCQFTSRTVQDIIQKATGDIEVIVMLDGYWANPPIKDAKNVTVVHLGKSKGMRENINAAVRIAKGDYIMKSDDHCMFGESFDEILQADCEENWISIPSRYSMDPIKWERTRGPVDYQYLTFPYYNDDTYGTGFHGKKWRGELGTEGGFWHREKERKHIKIDDIIVFQGSCWFMPKQHFYNIDCMDAKNYKFHQESIELAFKTWLSGGRVIRNKNTWYAHMHKSKKTGGRGYYISKKSMVDSELFSTDFWMNNRWPKQIHEFSWLVDKFGMADWPKNWNDPKWRKEWVHPWVAKQNKKKS
jgi:glycosyltransferase involved in cell wall biosynthesis